MPTFSQFSKTFVPGSQVNFSSLPERARSIQGLSAGFTSRLIAVFIDIALVALLVLGAWGGWEALRYIMSVFYTLPPATGIPLLIIGYLLMWLYWTWSWSVGGRSLGNILMGLRVQKRHGENLGLGLAAVRSALSIVFALGLFWSIVSRKNKSLQDVVLGTEVVFDWAPLLPKVDMTFSMEDDQSKKDQA
jgi:uncharacterized RDD family membrane protein YckC